MTRCEHVKLLFLPRSGCKGPKRVCCVVFFCLVVSVWGAGSNRMKRMKSHIWITHHKKKCSDSGFHHSCSLRQKTGDAVGDDFADKCLQQFNCEWTDFSSWCWTRKERDVAHRPKSPDAAVRTYTQRCFAALKWSLSTRRVSHKVQLIRSRISCAFESTEAPCRYWRAQTRRPARSWAACANRSMSMIYLFCLGWTKDKKKGKKIFGKIN